jgi:hypothetical protein
MNLKDDLARLLAERKLLRQLLQDLTRYLVLDERERTKQPEQKIAELVQEPLKLSRRDSVAVTFLAQGAHNIILAFTNLNLLESPTHYWDIYNPIPGVGLAWPPLQDRLIALCGPLDETLSTMLAAA